MFAAGFLVDQLTRKYGLWYKHFRWLGHGSAMVARLGFFEKVRVGGVPLWQRLQEDRPLQDLGTVLNVLEFIHIKTCLLDAYDSEYPLVEPRELIPSFDAPLIEYKHLPAFSMVVFDRRISYQDEGFQFDLLASEGHPPVPGFVAANRALLKQRAPRNLAQEVDRVLGRRALTPMGRYIELMPLLGHMDRGHVVAKQKDGCFHLAGVYASFPSDLDGEIKRYGRKIHKFEPGNNQIYAANRHFVYRFYMEQSGFPICGERHTSAALFARRLQRRRQSYAVKVLGTSDRTITTLSSHLAQRLLPAVEKVALVAVPAKERDTIRRLKRGGYFLDPKRRVVILRVRYAHHRYHPDNVLEERAQSVASQEVIHPITGRVRDNLDILGLNQDRLLMLNDIVRGEFKGSILFMGRDRVEGTTSTSDRLKFLAAWLHKHRSILADYSPDNFTRAMKVIYSYFEDPAQQAEFQRRPELFARAKSETTGLRTYHRLRLLEKLVRGRRDAEGSRLQHNQILTILAHILAQEGPELAKDHPRAFRKLLRMCRRQLDNPYLRRHYLSKRPATRQARATVGQYRLLLALVRRMEELSEETETREGF